MRYIPVKIILAVAWLWLLTVSFGCFCDVHAQVAHQSENSSSDGWVSHQMNQPPPGTGDRYDVSADRLDEIRQLYMQARQEHESKKDLKPQNKK